MKYKKTKDYFDELLKMYPLVNLNDLKKIVNYGWNMIYLCNSYGSDINVLDKKFKCFIGRLSKNGLKAYGYYAAKLARKIRFMYKRRHIKWDGYYYFGLTKKQFEKYLEQVKNKKIKNIHFEKIYMYRVFEECKVFQSNNLYFFRIKWPYNTNKYTRYYESLDTKDAEFVMSRDPLKMYDLLTAYNKFKYL